MFCLLYLDLKKLESDETICIFQYISWDIVQFYILKRRLKCTVYSLILASFDLFSNV